MRVERLWRSWALAAGWAARAAAVVAATLLVSAALRAASGADSTPGRPLRVVTTTTDLRALVEAVGGDRVAAESLLAGAQDPHHFEPKPRQLAAMRGADVFVQIGLDHEPWARRLLSQAGNPKVHPGAPGYVDASKGLGEILEPVARTGRGAGHVHALGNTHYWLDPENAKPMTRLIADALSAVSPGDRALFERRRAEFVTRLDDGIQRWTRQLAPFRGQRVVAVHDSFPYLARRFGFTVVAHVELQPGIPPPPAHLARLAGVMRTHGVKLILSEAWLPDDVAERVARAAGATLVKLPTSVGSAPGTDDYVALLDRITESLVVSGTPARR